MSDPFDLDEYDAGLPANSGVSESRTPKSRETLPAAADYTQIEDLGVQDLGVSQAVSTARVRRAIPKLDADRLLNPVRGYPALLKTAPRVKYRRGHEQEYLQKYVMAHQIWANRLWPKANFGDCIAIVRRVGKDARVRKYVRDVIESEKYRSKGLRDSVGSRNLGRLNAGDEGGEGVGFRGGDGFRDGNGFRDGEGTRDGEGVGFRDGDRARDRTEEELTETGSNFTGSRPNETGSSSTSSRLNGEGSNFTGSRPNETGSSSTSLRPSGEGSSSTRLRPNGEGLTETESDSANSRPTEEEYTDLGTQPPTKSHSQSYTPDEPIDAAYPADDELEAARELYGDIDF